MKHLKLLPLALLLLITGFISGNAHAKDKSEKGILEKVKDAVVEVFTGDEDDNNSDKEHGNENALNQIDKNLEKHGGEHKGLENAREAVSKSKHKGRGDHDNADENGVIDDVADAVEEAVEDIVDTAEEALTGEETKASKDHKGKGHKK